MSDGYAIAVPPEFQCPITHEVMKDPVSTVDGQTYEKEAIQHWLQQGRLSSPATGLALHSKTLVPNIVLKSTIARFLEERPRQQERAVEYAELQARAESCERQLRELKDIRTRAVVPRIQYEHVSKRLRLLEPSTTSAEVSGTHASPSPENYDSLVKARLQDLNKQRASLEASRATVMQELEVLEGESMLEERASQEDRKVALISTKILALQDILLAKEIERDAKGKELVDQLAAVGVEMPTVLDDIRKDPAAPRKGAIPSAYAKLHCECLGLIGEQQRLADEVDMAERSANRHRQGFVRRSMLVRRVAALDAELASLSIAVSQADEGKTAMKSAAAWAHQVSKGAMQATQETLPMLVAAHTQYQSDLNACRCIALRNMVKNGFGVEDLRTLGITVQHLQEAEFTVNQMKEAGYPLCELKTCFAVAQLFESGFTLRQLRDAGYTAAEFKEGGFSALQLKEIDFTVAQLKEIDFTAAQLREAKFTLAQLKQAGFMANECKDAGFTANECKACGFDSASLFPLCASLHILQEGLEVLTMQGFGVLRARDRDNQGPWISEAWQGVSDSDQTRRNARAVGW